MAGNTVALAATMQEDAIEAMLNQYLAHEREVCKRTDPRVMQLAGSRLFSSNGFPYACLSRHNIGYYLDSQQENRALWYMEAITNVDAPTAEILRDALRILKTINAETDGVGGGISGLLHGLYCALNAMKALPPLRPGKPVHTIEIGPGSGWTTYFLTRFGCHTTTIDSNPNLVITQRCLMSHLPADAIARYHQMPWWDFYNREHAVPHQFDMIIANHMICEIPEWTRLYIAKWASLNLTEKGVMFCQAWGDEDFYSRQHATANLQRHGISPYMHTHGIKIPEISVFKKVHTQKVEAVKTARMAVPLTPPTPSLKTRVKILLLRRAPAVAHAIHRTRVKLMRISQEMRTTALVFDVFDHYKCLNGLPVESIVKEMGFDESSYTNPLFAWSGICH